MWSDRLPEARLRRLVERLRGVLPAPAPGSRRSKTPLRVAAYPLRVAERLRGEHGFVWLDGGGGGHRLASGPIATLIAGKGRCTVTGPGGRIGFTGGGFDLLAAAFAAWGGDGGVLAGYLGYEMGGELEPLPAPPPDDLGVPDLHLHLYDWMLVGDGRSWSLEATDAWAGPAGVTERLLQAERLLGEAARSEPANVADVPPGRLTAGPVVSRPHRTGFEAAVRRGVERIGTGEIFQVNLCRRLEAPLPAPLLWPCHLRLRAASPADHGAFLDLGAAGGPGGRRALLSVSPELFLSVREGRVETRPIKGTRPRGANPREDRALARELAESEKDRAELTMIVDVARNDLGRVCETGSVEVVQHGAVVTLPTVHHTVSTIRGRLRPDVGVPELLRATFPAASITGAPKIQAMKVIAAEEEVRRGPAMGAFGWLSLAGDLDLAVAIRTAVAARGRIAYHAGCGIVADSDPELELEESTAKARAFLTALGRAGALVTSVFWNGRLAGRDDVRIALEDAGFLFGDGLFETLRVDAGEARDVEAHLDRLTAGLHRLEIAIPEERAALEDAVAAVAEAAPRPTARLRVTITRGLGGTPTRLIATAPYEPPSEDLYRQGVPVILVPDLRIDSRGPLAGLKSLNYQMNRLALRRAEQAGAWEALLLNERGRLVEGSRCNIALVLSDGTFTPPLEDGCLPGTVRRRLLEKGEIRERSLFPGDLAAARQILLMNSLIGVLPVSKLR